MKTKSIWGSPPSRLYSLINKANNLLGESYSVCIVGCSDGKFLLPFARIGKKVTGYDVDTIDLFGGYKEFPIRNNAPIATYNKNFISPTYPLERRYVDGVCKRLNMEGLESVCTIEERDFYKNVPEQRFDVVFTSCSLHYTLNNVFTLKEKVEKLRSIVSSNGILYMDYMMALEEEDYINYPDYKFFRNGEAKSYFGNDWEILSYYEQKKPVFEAAHVITTYDHFHRFGFLMVQRKVRSNNDK